MLRLSDQQFIGVYDTLQAYAKQCIDHKYPCGNGGWIQYRVTSKELVKDIGILLSIKCK